MVMFGCINWPTRSHSPSLWTRTTSLCPGNFFSKRCRLSACRLSLVGTRQSLNSDHDGTSDQGERVQPIYIYDLGDCDYICCFRCTQLEIGGGGGGGYIYFFLKTYLFFVCPQDVSYVLLGAYIPCYHVLLTCIFDKTT